MAGIHRTRPAAEAIAAANGAPARDLGDGVWMSQGLSNSYLIRASRARVVINAGMGFEGGFHRANFDAIDTSPIAALIFTQGHYDHVGGARHLSELHTELIAQENFAVWRADNERLEQFRSRNAAFAWIDAIVAAMDHARRHGAGDLSQARPEPTLTFRDHHVFDLDDGRRLELIATPGGETFDSSVVWLPESRTLFSGNLFGPLFGHVPNLVTIRGDRYRDALSYIASLDTVLDLQPERLITGHFDPIEGAATIREELQTLRAAMQSVHDQTVAGMNNGATVHELMRDVRVPRDLDVGEGYGKTSWNVRAIWENYAGWFHHRSTTELYSTPPSSVSADIVAAAGTTALVAAARDRLAADEPVAALHLTDLVLNVDPSEAGALAVARSATELLLVRSSNFWETAWLRRSLDKLTAAARA